MGLRLRFEDSGSCVLDLGRGSMELGVWLDGREREIWHHGILSARRRHAFGTPTHIPVRSR